MNLGGLFCLSSAILFSRMDDLATLVLFPGLAVDRELYRPQRSIPYRVEPVDWIEPESRNETLAHYMRRMAASIEPRPNLFLGGVSLGAMAALQAAHYLDARGVIMIDGCFSHRQIAPMFRAVLAAGATLPDQWVRPVLTLGPLGLRMFENLNVDQERLMARMFRRHSPAQIRWSCRAILGWENTNPPGVPVHAIHGEDDEVIPLRNVRPQQVVKSGRHLISLSHPAQVNEFIGKSIAAACRCC